jgi:hypothetical protein
VFTAPYGLDLYVEFRLDTEFTSPWRRGVDPTPVHVKFVGFVADRVAL